MKAILVSMCLLCGGASALAQRPQMVFSAEDETVLRTIALPSELKALLAQDPDVNELLDAGQTEPPDSWFLVSEASLSESGEGQMILVGRDPIRGANVTTFWIVQRRNAMFDILLKVVAHTMTIQNEQTNGYRNIEALSHTALIVTTRQFQFDGSRYRLSNTTTAPIP